MFRGILGLFIGACLGRLGAAGYHQEGGSSSVNYFPEVVIAQGTVRGLREVTPVSSRPYFSFRGIPYAEPPVESLRFKEPVKAGKWLGIWNATEMPPDCLQLIEGVPDWRFQVIGSENCLFLNVYTPKINKNDALMKVIVFIHGGAFMYLSSNYLGPQYLMEKDVVLVTMNYRLGPLGFLSTGDEVVPGNNGLKDQNLALKWVRDNIKSFGGNPRQVTLAGQSSGSRSVIFHMFSRQSQGLFSHAMALSGSPLSPWAVTEAAAIKAKRLANRFGCPTVDSKEMIECLRSRPVHSIVHASTMFMPWRFFSPYGLVIEPESPDAFMDAQPIKILKEGQSADVPLLMSFTDEEGIYPGRGLLGNPGDMKKLENNWSELLPLLLDYNYTVSDNRREWTAQLIKEKYSPETPKNFIKMISDRLFFAGIGEMARIYSARYNSPTYSYRFRYAQKSVNISRIYQGVGHGDDLPFILRDRRRPVGGQPEDLAVSNLMIDTWMNFISDRMPPDWTTVNGNKEREFTYREINEADARLNPMRSVNDFGNETFWKSLGLNENPV